MSINTFDTSRLGYAVLLGLATALSAAAAIADDGYYYAASGKTAERDAPAEEPVEEYADVDYWSIGIETSVAASRLSGHLRVDDDKVPVDGTRMDLSDTLGLHEAEPSGRIEISAGRGPHRLAASWEHVSFGGNAILDADAILQRHLFSAGQEIETRLDIDDVRMEYAFENLAQLSIVRFSPMLGVEMVRLRTRVTSAAQRVTETVLIPAPVFGARVDIDFAARLSLSAEARVGPWLLADSRGTLRGARLRLNWSVTESLRLFIGYQIFLLENDTAGKSHTQEMRTGIDGILFGAEASF